MGETRPGSGAGVPARETRPLPITTTTTSSSSSSSSEDDSEKLRSNIVVVAVGGRRGEAWALARRGDEVGRVRVFLWAWVSSWGWGKQGPGSVKVLAFF